MSYLQVREELGVLVQRVKENSDMPGPKKDGLSGGATEQGWTTKRPIAAGNPTNKQGRTDVLPPHEAKKILNRLTESAERSFDYYQEMLNQDASGSVVDQDRPGLSRELARIGLPLSTYTQWYWKIDLHN